MKTFKVTTYKDEHKVKVEYHTNYKPFKYKSSPTRHTSLKVKNKEYPFMTLTQYIKTLNRKRVELNNLCLKDENCLALTLTTKFCNTWQELNLMFQVFINNVKRNFANAKYIRAFEPHEKGNHFHIHLLLIFENAIPTQMNELWVSKHWKHGRIDFKTTWDTNGFIDYITCADNRNVINPLDTDIVYTKFPQWVKVISCSQNIPKSCIDNVKYVDEIELKQLRQEFIDNHPLDHKPFLKKCKHKYIDKSTGEIVECIDREFWH